MESLEYQFVLSCGSFVYNQIVGLNRVLSAEKLETNYVKN